MLSWNQEKISSEFFFDNNSRRGIEKLHQPEEINTERKISGSSDRKKKAE